MSLIIGISGGSGSGKTSFISELSHLITSEDLTVISQDDYYKPKELQKKDKNGIINFDLPKSIYLDDFAKDIQSLIRGEEVRRTEYTFNNSEANPKQLIFKPAPIIVVEGLFIFHHKPIRKLLDLKVLIHATTSDKIIRRILRDQTERNYPIDDVLYRYKHHVMPAYEKYIATYESKVDIIINNNHNYKKGLEVMSGYLANTLSSTVM